MKENLYKRRKIKAKKIFKERHRLLAKGKRSIEDYFKAKEDMDKKYMNILKRLLR
jgi:hypothetical protein